MNLFVPLTAIIPLLLSLLSSVESVFYVNRYMIDIENVKLHRDIEVDCAELYIKIYIGVKDSAGYHTKDSGESDIEELCLRPDATWWWETENGFTIEVDVDEEAPYNWNWLKIEYWEEDSFLKGGDDYAGKTESTNFHCENYRDWKMLPSALNSGTHLVGSDVWVNCQFVDRELDDATIWDHNRHRDRNNYTRFHVMISVVTSFVVIAVCLMLFYCLKKKRNGQHTQTYKEVIQNEEEEQ